jgi:hypothetical protein
VGLAPACLLTSIRTASSPRAGNAITRARVILAAGYVTLAFDHFLAEHL